MIEFVTRNGIILERIRKEEKLANHFWYAANYVKDPKHKKRLTTKAFLHYSNVLKLKRNLAA